MPDVVVEVADDLAEKVVGAIPIPYLIVEKKEKFSEASSFIKKLAAGGPEDLQDLESKAKLKGGGGKWAGEFIQKVDELRAFVSKIDDSRQEALEKGLDWEGPTEDETAQFRVFGDWDAKFHLAWIKVLLVSRPSIQLASPVTTVNNIDVKVSATGEIWAKHPWWKCVKKKFGICYKWKKIVKWERLASITVEGVKVSADVTSKFLVEKLDVLGEPRFKRLRLGYPILEKIPIEPIVNDSLAKKSNKGRFVVFLAQDLEFNILNSKWVPKAVQLPGHASKLVASVTYKKG